MKTKLTEALIFLRVFQTILATIATILVIVITMTLLTTYAELIVTATGILVIVAILTGTLTAWWIYFKPKKTDR